MSILLIVSFGTVAFAQISVPGVPDHRETIERVFEFANQVELGFPFQVKKRLRYDTLTVGEAIKAIYDSQVLTTEEGYKYLFDGIKSDFTELQNLQWKSLYQGVINMGALSYAAGDRIDVAHLMASLILVSKKGYMPEIEPFLLLAKTHFGTETEISDAKWITDYPDKELTDKERLTFFPAANAILSNPTQSVPLLKTALKNQDLHILLRYRAAAFLKDLDKESLMKMTSELDNESLKQQVGCILERDTSWRYVNVDNCYVDEDADLLMEIIRNRGKKPATEGNQPTQDEQSQVEYYDDLR